MNDVLQALLERDLIQFGYFEDGEPIRFRLDLLPAYPDVLQLIANQLAVRISQSVAVDRIVCTRDAIAPALALSLQTSIPLVYGSDTSRAPVHDLVGAYDVGHPAALMTLVIDDVKKLSEFMRRMKRVGLETQHIYSIVTLTNLDRIDGLPVTALLRFADIAGAAPNGVSAKRNLEQWRSAQVG